MELTQDFRGDTAQSQELIKEMKQWLLNPEHKGDHVGPLDNLLNHIDTSTKLRERSSSGFFDYVGKGIYLTYS